MERIVRIRTGVGGMDMFEEVMDKQLGFTRVYVGKKVPSFLSAIRPWKKNLAGKYYRLLPEPKVYITNEKIVIDKVDELTEEKLTEVFKKFFNMGS